MAIGLSKSKYCRGVQCPKILWMDKHMPEEAVDMASEAILANGTKVGELARGYFGDYSEVEYSDDKTAMCRRTQELIEAGTEIITEAISIPLICSLTKITTGTFRHFSLMRCRTEAYRFWICGRFSKAAGIWWTFLPEQIIISV